MGSYAKNVVKDEWLGLARESGETAIYFEEFARKAIDLAIRVEGM
jgi:hypothetical protein